MSSHAPTQVPTQVLGAAASSFAFVSGLSLFLIIAITSFHIFTVIIDKTLFNLDGISGIEEIIALLSGTAFFMAFPYAQISAVHIQIDFIPWPHALISSSSHLSFFLFSLLYFSLAFALLFGLLDSYSDKASSSVLAIPFWPFYIPPILAFALSGLISSSQIFNPPPSV